MSRVPHEADLLNMLDGIVRYARGNAPLAPLAQLAERALGGDEQAESTILLALEEASRPVPGAGRDPAPPEPEPDWTTSGVRALAGRVVARLEDGILGEVARLLDRSPVAVLDEFIAEVVRLAAGRLVVAR